MARQMLKRAFDAGVHAGWVTGDTIYGSARRLRMFLEERGQPFVLALKSDESLWTLEERGPRQLCAEKIAEGVKPEEWRRLSAGAGSKGERLYEWALLPLFRLQLSVEERYWGHWLLVRRNVEDSEELAYYVVFAPKESTTLEELVRVAGTRWRIESCFEEAKDGFGLAQYEVRKWEGWYRHVTLCLLAHAFVCVVRSEGVRREASAKGLLPLTVPEVRRLLYLLAYYADAPRRGGARLVILETPPPTSGQKMPLPKPGSRPRRELSRVVECERLKALAPRRYSSNGEREETQGQKALPKEASRRKPATSGSPHPFW
jgi:hypothetical protein